MGRAEPRSLADKHSNSPVTSAELLRITEKAVFKGVKQTQFHLPDSEDSSESPQGAW